MCRLKKIFLLSIVVIAFWAGSAGAQSRPVGDLSEDFKVDWEDLQIFADQWLDDGGCSEPNCADLYVDNIVNMLDFALLAENWRKEGLTLVISEFMASNDEILADEDGDYPDWIEILNISEITVDLEGWYLRDDSGQWQFPGGVSLKPGQTLVVFASEKNRTGDPNYLHTNFELDKDGDYLALVRPDGLTIEHEFFPTYPEQREDISYGFEGEKTTLIPPAGSVKYFVPGSDIGQDWRGGDEPFDETGWTAATTGIGYSTFADHNLQAYWAFEGSGSTATDSSNYSRDGTIHGASRTSNGKIGKALNFDGYNDYVSINVPGSMQQMTLSMWVNFDFVSEPNPEEGTVVSPLSHVGEETGASYFIINSWGYLRFTVIGQSNECKLVSSDTITLDRWHHLLVTYDNINHFGQIYIDGKLEGFTENTVGPVLVGDSTIGMNNWEDWCDARIDEVAIWNKILDKEEIAKLAAGVSAANIYRYDDLVETDISAQMQGNNSSAYMRFHFDVEDLCDVEYLTLKMKYDDGFVAFLNGTEVARSNAPVDIQWNSFATSSRPNKECMLFKDFNLTTYLSQLQTGTNVLAIQGLNVNKNDEDFLIFPELNAYKLFADSMCFFEDPTPGASNAAGFVDFVADTTFSVDRGFYDTEFDVAITCDTEGATIRYTLDYSEPNETHGTVYSVPINITTTTCLRAAAFKTGWIPTNVDTQTYIFPADVANQPDNPPGMPATWKDGFPADYEVDPDVVDYTLPGYGFEDALLSVPTISIVTDHDHLWSEETGIYYNDSPENEWAVKEQNNRWWERPTSVEFIYPDSNDGYQIDCGIRIHGAITRSHWFTPKHSFRLFFRGDYGAKKLNFPLFPDSDVDKFDQIVLRASDVWESYINDQWMRDAPGDMGHPTSHGIYAHVYLNGLYWGLYNVCERLHNSFWAEHCGGEKEEYDVLKDWVELHYGSMDAWNEMMELASEGLEDNEAYQKIQGNNPDGSRNPNYPVLVDIENLIDYMIPHIHSNAVDWAGHNWWGARKRGSESEGFKFGTWDQQGVFEIEGRGWQSTPVEEVDDMGPAYVYDKLRRNEEFKIKFADRVHKHMFNCGALSVQANQQRWMARADEIDKAVVAESARWGDAGDEPPFTREDDWIDRISDVNDWYFPEVNEPALQRFRNVDLYPDTEAPVFYINGGYQHGGYISPPASLTMTAPAGTIYYTVDGNDPYVLPTVSDSVAIISEDAAKAVLIPTETYPSGTAWRTNPGYDDSGWNDYTYVSGKAGGVGYDNEWEYEQDLISYNVESEMSGVNTSCYIRIPFEVSETILSNFNRMKLNLRYDDGFIAYLNGTEVARENYSGTAQWNSSSEGVHNGEEAMNFQKLDISGYIGELSAGTNVLSIHGLNQKPGLLVGYEFEGNLNDSSGNGYNGIASSSPSPAYASDSPLGIGGSQCLELNGSNYVEIPLGADNPLAGDTDFTIVAWFRTPSAEGDCLLTCSDENPEGPTEHPMSMWYGSVPNEGDGAEGGINYDNWWAGQIRSDEFAVDDGQWHHVAITYQASTEQMYLYVDGDIHDDGFFNPSIPDIEDTIIRIGRPIHDWDGNLDGWDGVIDEVGIFSCVLTEGQINSVISGGIGNVGAISDESFLVSAELVMEQVLEGGSSSSAVEYTGGDIILDETTHVKARAVDGGEWSALNEAVYAVESVKDNLRITEIMYHPVDANDPNTEFIELTNIGESIINLNLVSFTDGIYFTFPYLQLGPDEYVVVANNIEAFEAEYGTGINIAGQYTGRLDNGGEDIRLVDANNAIILEFDYEDDWYPITDGFGFSLNIIDPCNPDTNSWDQKSGWRPSSAIGGTPGAYDSGATYNPDDVVINELLAHSHGTPDWIELHNTTDEPINIGGWFLSDSDANLMKYEIKTGTIIDPCGYILFYQDPNFGDTNDPGCHIPFALSENGETLYLSSGLNGELTGYSEEEEFGPSETAVTFGRYVTSTNDIHFVAMSSPTPKAANAYPKVGPIVITEIMYHPISNSDAEFIELYNKTGATVYLFDAEANPWKFEDDDDPGIDYLFPTDANLPAYSYAVLVKNKGAFQSEGYLAVPPGVQIFEWGSGKLDNAGEEVLIGMPGDIDGGQRQYIRIDSVEYDDNPPWPIEPDGTGTSLTRIFINAYANDPNNWQAASPTPGQ